MKPLFCIRCVLKQSTKLMEARDSSRKISAVFTDRMERGLRCSGAIPYGYYRKPNDKQTLYVDEEAAKVVRRIFDMVVQGYSYNEIIRIFHDEKILIPAEYERIHSPSDCRHNPVPDPYMWNSTTLGYIIHRQEYLGHTVLKKSKGISYKSKKRVNVAAEDQMVFKNTHEPIIDEETWKLANKIKARKKKTPYAEDPFNLIIASFSSAHAWHISGTLPDNNGGDVSQFAGNK